MSNRIVPVILSGGSGTRLWPMSTPERPKQMLALVSEGTMLQQTAIRAAGTMFAPPIVVANERHTDTIEAQLNAVGASPQTLILEPVGRNTAPAIALAALAVGAGDTALLVMPSDHLIADVPAFHEAVERALTVVRDGALVTFGIAPDAPATGYGWIQIGEPIGENVNVFTVKRFVEKPPLDLAEAMLANGEHLWNGGIFLFRADRYLEELGRFEPELLDSCERAMVKARHEKGRIYPDGKSFTASPSQSIDYAVMEKAKQVAVVPVSMGWNDLGSWDAVHAISSHDSMGNACSGDVVAVDTRNCLVHSEGPRIRLVGASDLIIVASGEDILILPRGRSQEVKKLLNVMK